MKKQVQRLFQFTIIVATAVLLTVGIPNTATASPGQDSWWCLWFCAEHDAGPRDDGLSDGGGNGVPEIDPSTAGLALGLVGGGLAILRDRRRRR